MTTFTTFLYDANITTTAIGGDDMAKAENRLKGSYRNIIELPISTANIQAGHDWYVDANKIARTVGSLAGHTNENAVKVGSGVLSALSPQRDWDINISQALLLVTEGIHKHFKVQCDKAVAIMQGKEPLKVLGARATKTKAFYQAILEPNNDYSQPVIDRHAVAVYMGRSVSDKELKALDSSKVYNRIANAYIRASKVVGMNHHVLQAMTWTQWRENKGITSAASRQVGKA